MKQKVKNLLNRLLFLLPSKLPIGMQEFENWASSIIATYEFPDNDSLRFTLASMVLHVPQTYKLEINLLIFKWIVEYASSSKPKSYFAKTILKSMSNQIAGGVIQDLKEKQKKSIEEASDAKAKV